ncbi:methyl-accepting chemotaxis protein [Palaeococcus ferrophilus]|uniref:methyl-accepting chemotaxis protein n=1 Tax=Palaeococcus ferrophilus TaxID=83868 RepID=UPI000698B9C6|nr:methyl-accepting chemotaxis protein [Palaeococcus ferrophilus]
MDMRKTVRVGIIIVLILNLVSVTGVFIYASKAKADGVVIDLAGRQRMLTQKMSKEALAIAVGEDNYREELLATAELFDKSLKALLYGGTAPIHNKEQSIPPAPPEVQAQLKKVEALWQPFYRNVQIVATKDTSDPQFKDALEYILTHNVELLTEMNKAVGLYSGTYGRKLTYLKIYLVGMLALSISVGVYLLRYLERIINDFMSLHETSIKHGETLEDELKHLVDYITALSSGDLTVTPGEGSAEFERVHRALSEFREKLIKTVSTLNEITLGLKANSERLLEMSKDGVRLVEQGTEAVRQIAIEAQRQQENINEITEGMRYVSEISDQSIRSMEEFEGSMREVVIMANDGREKSRISAEKIKRIQSTIGDVKDAVDSIRDMGKNIENITNVITGIAEQTNLLALNAAIEAARAGEAGKGFAVVAEEIQGLAEESKKAAENIRAIITQMSDRIENTVDLTEHSVNIVEESSSSLEETVQYLKNIAEMIEEVTPQMEEVKDSIMRTKEAAEKALKAMENLAASAEETTASTEEVTSTMEEQGRIVRSLEDMAATINGAVGRIVPIVESFKLPEKGLVKRVVEEVRSRIS